MLDVEQRGIYDRIDKALKTNIFIEGRGGVGKTFLFKLLANLVRSREQIVLACAYSGLAASNYRGGSTFHFRYKFSIPFDATSTSGLKPNDINAEAASRSSSR